jgi:hypothetical protein
MDAFAFFPRRLPKPLPYPAASYSEGCNSGQPERDR